LATLAALACTGAFAPLGLALSLPEEAFSFELFPLVVGLLFGSGELGRFWLVR
jgi:hypothetical protein